MAINCPDGRRRTSVLFISSAEAPGADTFIHMQIMRALDRARFDVHVACSTGPPGNQTAGHAALAAIPDIRLRAADFGPSLSELSAVRKITSVPHVVGSLASLVLLARYVRRNRIAVLHSTDRPRDAVACALLGRLTGARSIIHAHLKCADWMGGSLRWAMGHVDGLIGVSEFVARSLVDHGYERRRTYVVLNAIDLTRWDPQLDGRTVRQYFGIPPTAPVIASAGRLFEAKGQHLVVQALASVRDEFPDLRLLVIGEDDRQVMRESFTAQLNRLATDLGVADRVIFTGRRADMPEMMAASDLFALPSDEEPFGLVFAEAMAMKKPVLAVDNGGTPEVVDHGRSGLLSAPGDAEGLAVNLRTLLRNPALRQRMGEHGRQQVEARFTAARLADDTARVYAAVLGTARD